jgi:hypothetical protein
MKKLLIFLLIGLVLAACASAPKSQANGSNAYANSPSSPGSLALSPTLAMTANPGTGPGDPTSGIKPSGIIVRPPIVLLGPGQGTQGVTPVPLSPPGWLTFTSPELGIAVDHPSGWSATQQGEEVTFKSPQGQIIQLQPATPEAAGLDCTSLINASGLTVNVCADSASGLYRATFATKTADGAAVNLMLSTTDPGAVDTYKAMLNSLRPIN